MKVLSNFFLIFGTMLLTNSVAALALDKAGKQVLIESKIVELDWARAQAMPTDTGAPSADLAWTAFWRNRAGAVGSELVALRLESKTGNTSDPLTLGSGDGALPSPPADPNARFRAGFREHAVARIYGLWRLSAAVGVIVLVRSAGLLQSIRLRRD